MKKNIKASPVVPKTSEVMVDDFDKNILPAEESLKENEMPKSEEGDNYTIEIVRDYYNNVDVTYLSNKDPNFAYRWLRYEHKNLSIKSSNLLFAKGGWQLCPKEHLLKIGIKPSEIWSDGLLHRGDMVLARMPKKLHEEKLKFKKKEADDQMRQVDRKLKEGDSSVGGKEMHETMRGIQTAQQLGMK